MADRVTPALLLKEQREQRPLYDPVEGLEYEVGKNIVVRLKDATVGLQKQYLEASETLREVITTLHAQFDEGAITQVELIERRTEECAKVVRLITEGTLPEDTSALRFNVLYRITEDFTIASSLIARPATPLQPQQLQLLQSLFGSLAGQDNGVGATTDAR